MLIGDLGRRTGLATSAIRYYERVGLLSPAGRANGRRHFGAPAVKRVALIRLCQDAGFTLMEIRGLLGAGTRRRRTWRRLVQGKFLELEASIARAQRAKSLIQHALACPHRDLSTCPNFRSAVNARLGPDARSAAPHRFRSCD
jgi:DNA-binding transcriptional MerR regulator